jgi:cytochrome c peroxidase
MKNQIQRIGPAQHAVILLFVFVGVGLAVTDFWVRKEAVKWPDAPGKTDGVINQAITPIPSTIKLDERKVLLGERLYHDTRLSSDNTISCASCHDLKKGGTDQAKDSTGVNRTLGPINSPTTYNSGLFFSQFWDGRAGDLAEQAAGPVNNPREMGSSWPEVISKLSKDPSYTRTFAEAYSNGIQGVTICDAIAEYEKSLITPNSRFDRFLNGDNQALSADEKEGWRLFKEFGCISCHQGVGVGGNMYQTLGVMENYFSRRATTKVDLGRFNVTGQEWNRYQFKVPSLRNIEKTYPYLHDGSAETLKDVLQVMWKNQLGRPISDEESTKIVKFLKTLTGTYKGGQLL